MTSRWWDSDHWGKIGHHKFQGSVLWQRGEPQVRRRKTPITVPILAWISALLLVAGTLGSGQASAATGGSGLASLDGAHLEAQLQVAPRPEDTVPVLYSSAPNRPDPALQDIVNDVIGSQPGTWGVVVKKLDTGQYAAFGADRQQVSASLYKLWVLEEVYRQVREGRVSMDGPNGVGDLVTSMIQWSSNYAAESLVNILGPDNVNADMQQTGLTHSVLDWSGIGDNLTTARDISRWLELAATGRLVDMQASREMIGIMLGQQLNDLLPQGVPGPVPIAHKTGSLDMLQHDAGIVYAPSGPYIIVCMSSDLPNYTGATQAQIDLSSRVYNYFAGSSGSAFRFFPETNQSLGNGFFKFWNTQGGLDMFGYPLTSETSQGGLTVQWFERARMEWHPEVAGNSGSAQLEPGVLLGRLGVERADQLGLHWAPSSPSGSGQFFPQTGQEITGAFLQYWQENGAERLFGYPISPAQPMVSPEDGKTYLTQWFERARFELHTELPSGPHVMLARLGAELLQNQSAHTSAKNNTNTANHSDSNK